MAWKSYTPSTLEWARHSGRPTILFFDAAECEPCRKMRQKTFRDREVIHALQPFVCLRADLSNPWSPGRKLVKPFGIEDLPVMIFFDSKGDEQSDLRRVGYVSPKGFLDYLGRYHQYL